MVGKRLFEYVVSLLLMLPLMLSGCCPPWGDCDPTCQVTPQNLDFGSITVGSHRDITFQIKNTGGGTLEGTVGEGCADYTIVSGGGNFSLDADQTREVKVRFAPSSPGVKVCTVSVGTGSCTGVRCTGEADPGPQCQVFPASLDFDSVQVGSYQDLSFEIENVGTGILAGDVSAAGCWGFALVSGMGAFDLGPSETQVVTVRFAPAIAGARTCYVDLGSDSCAALMCVGVGTPGVECAVTPDTLDFGSVQIGTFEELTFDIENTGEGTLSGYVNEGCSYYSIQSGAGAYGLTAGQTHSVTVRFTPTNTAEATCTVDLGIVFCPGVFCFGRGNTGPECLIVPSRLDFGQVEENTYKDLTFTISNVGSGTLTGTVSEACGDYSIQSGAGNYALAAGEGRVVTVRFMPSIDDQIDCTVETGTGLCPNVSCTGVGTPGPECKVTPASLDFGSVRMREYKTLTFEIENVGGGTLIGSITETCNDYTIYEGAGDFKLDSGETLTVGVMFSPSRTGIISCWVRTGLPDCSSIVCTGVGLRWDGGTSR